ncbi:MAG: hypothetical protein LRZ88_11445 [Candidatus Cloacimonetes bacterium]|nr:hypothetical protein [Candidatus Cloacimonadota bacterium]
MLGSVAGVTLAPGASHSFPISWTPTVEGPMQLRGKVVLTGDQNPQNDVTQPYPITVMPEGLAVITIGDGSMMDRVPVDMYWRNSLFQTLYYPQEINMFGSISAIAFYNSFVTNLPQMPVKIWLGTTANDDLSGGWIPSTALTLVFDGNVDFPSGTNTITIPLTTPFVYTGGNLVMMVNRPMILSITVLWTLPGPKRNSTQSFTTAKLTARSFCLMLLQLAPQQAPYSPRHHCI